jgi:hypothetical protein
VKSEKEDARMGRGSKGIRLLYLRRRRLSSVQEGERKRSSWADVAGLSRLKPVLDGEGWIVTGIFAAPGDGNLLSLVIPLSRVDL